MGAYLKKAEDKDLYLLANQLEKKLNEAREELRRETDRYLRQSVFSTYVTEETLVQLALRCQRRKSELIEVRDLLKERGRNQYSPYRNVDFADGIKYDINAQFGGS